MTGEKMNVIIFGLVVICLFNCTSSQSKKEVNRGDEASETFWVRNVGDRQNILMKNDLTARIFLDSLANISNLYAIGSVEGLQGEVTIYDGVPLISTVANRTPKVDTSLNYHAAFLAYASIPNWKQIEIEKPLNGLGEVEKYVEELAFQYELSTEEPFAFRIEGKVDSLVYHIIYKTGSLPNNKVEHQKAKRKFSLINENIQVIGFRADELGEGVYTHPGKRTHLHFKTPNNTTSGHVDYNIIQQGSILFLPNRD
ncbi:MAG: acetolactate decarboxylase [Bacteroidota bacterium]